MSNIMRKQQTSELSGPGTGVSGGQFAAHTGGAGDVDVDLRSPTPAVLRQAMHDVSAAQARLEFAAAISDDNMSGEVRAEGELLYHRMRDAIIASGGSIDPELDQRCRDHEVFTQSRDETRDPEGYWTAKEQFLDLATELRDSVEDPNRAGKPALPYPDPSDYGPDPSLPRNMEPTMSTHRWVQQRWPDLPDARRNQAALELDQCGTVYQWMTGDDLEAAAEAFQDSDWMLVDIPNADDVDWREIAALNADAMLQQRARVVAGMDADQQQQRKGQ